MTTFNLEQIKDAGWLKEANYIDGQWVSADDSSSLGVNDPATETQIGQIPWSGAVETRRAIDAAQAAFSSWSLTTAAERATLLNRMAQLVRDNLDILASMLTLEQGKPLAEARNEMKLGADYIQWFAEEARRINGEIIPSPWNDRQILVTREPVGVVGAISPWNFPFSMLSRKIGRPWPPAAQSSSNRQSSRRFPACSMACWRRRSASPLVWSMWSLATGPRLGVNSRLTTWCARSPSPAPPASASCCTNNLPTA